MFKLCHEMEDVVAFQSIGNKDHRSFSSIMETTCFQSIKYETNLKLLNLGLNIKDNMLCALFLSYFLKMKENQLKRHILFF